MHTGEKVVQWALGRVTPVRFGRALVVVLTLWGVKATVAWVMEWMVSRQYERERREFRAQCAVMHRDMKRQVVESKITDEEVRCVLSLPLDELVEKMKKSELQPSYVMMAYMAKALEVHEITNCIIHPFPGALEEARALDAAVDRDKVLFGVPLCVKDDNAIKGYTSAIGLSCLLRYTAQEDSNIVKTMREHGAVPFVKTNVPQMALSLQCSNPITGETVNPLDPRRTPGGSSGGDGALVGGGGALLGVGSDLGGSLRVPATFSGACCLKPTGERVTNKGQYHTTEQTGRTRVVGATGPMGQDVGCLVAFCRAAFSKEAHKRDTLIPPLTFRDDLYNRKTPLRIGYYFGDHLFPVTPASKRAVRIAKRALEARGHTVVEWTPPDMSKAMRFNGADMYGDNHESIKPYLYGDVIDHCLRPMLDFKQGPDTWWSRLKIKLISISDQRKAEHMRSGIGIKNLHDYWKTTAELTEWRRNIETSFNDAGLDAILCTGWPTVAPFKGERSGLETRYMWPHTLFWNVMNTPVGVLPVTKVTTDDVAALKGYHGEMAAWILDDIKEEMRTGVGLPLSVQVGSLWWQEETVLRAMMEVQEGLKLL